MVPLETDRDSDQRAQDFFDFLEFLRSHLVFNDNKSQVCVSLCTCARCVFDFVTKLFSLEVSILPQGPVKGLTEKDVKNAIEKNVPLGSEGSPKSSTAAPDSGLRTKKKI